MHASTKIKDKKPEEDIQESARREDYSALQEKKAKCRKMRQLRRLAQGHPKGTALQNEDNGQDKEKARKAVWRSALQQVHKADNGRQIQAIKLIFNAPLRNNTITTSTIRKI